MPWIKRKPSLKKRLSKGFNAYGFKGKSKAARKLLKIRLILITIAVLFIVIISATLAIHSTSISPPPPASE